MSADLIVAALLLYVVVTRPVRPLTRFGLALIALLLLSALLSERPSPAQPQG